VNLRLNLELFRIQHRFFWQEVVLSRFFAKYQSGGVFSMVFWHGIPLGVDFRGRHAGVVKYAQSAGSPGIHADWFGAGLKNRSRTGI